MYRFLIAILLAVGFGCPAYSQCTQVIGGVTTTVPCGVTIGGLTSAASPTGTEIVPISQGGNTVGATLNQVKTFVGNGLAPGTVTDTMAALSNKPSAFLASTTNIASLSGLPTIDGVTMTRAGVVLLTGQTTQSQNGPWCVPASGTWARCPWYPTAGTVQAFVDATIQIRAGTVYSGALFKLATPTTGTITIDTTATTWTVSPVALGSIAPQASGTIAGCPSGGSPCIQALTALPTGLTVPAAQVVSNPALNTSFSLTQATGGSDVYPSNSTPILTTQNGNLVEGPANGTKIAIATLAGTFAQAYHFGDSITAGYETSGYNNSAYPYWIDQAVLSPTSSRINYGVPGASSNSSDTIIFPAAFNYSNQTLITYTIGTNNYAANGNGTTALATYLANVEAQAAWWLVPASQKTVFGTGSVTFTGTWTTDTGGYIGKATTGSGATATFTGTGTILYVATLAANSNASTASLTCDSVATGATLNFTATGGNQTQLTRVTGLSSGSHTCVITATAISGGTVDIQWVGFLTGSTVTTSPYVILGGVPPQQANANAAALTTYRTQQQSAVTALNGDGLANLYYADTTTVTSATAYYNDTFHGDPYWQYLLAQPFITKINSIFSTSYTLAWTPSPVVDFLNIGGSSMYIGSFNSNTNITATNVTRTYAWGGGALSTALQGVGAINDDIAIGSNALSSFTGNYTTAVGTSTGGAGSGTSLGAYFGYFACNAGTGVQLACFGGQAGGTFTSGSVGLTSDSHDAFIGSGSGKSTASVITDATALGDSALASASHQMMFGAATVTQNVFHGGFTEGSNGRAVNTGTASDTIAVNITSTYESANTGSGAFTLTFAAPSGDGERRRVCFHNLTGTITYTPTSPATAIVGPATIAANTCQEWVYNSASGTPTNAPATTWLPY